MYTPPDAVALTSTLSPGLSPTASRTFLGSVTWPLTVMVVVMIRSGNFQSLRIDRRVFHRISTGHFHQFVGAGTADQSAFREGVKLGLVIVIRAGLFDIHAARCGGPHLHLVPGLQAHGITHFLVQRHSAFDRDGRC